MRFPFEKEEIKKSINKLGDNKAIDINKMKAEQLKNSTDKVSEIIADIFNEIAQTGNYPK